IVLYVARPLVTLCFLERPIEFGALDGQPVSVLFSLISPSTRAHLHILSQPSFALHDEHFRETVLRRSPADVILREARRAESTLTTGGKAASCDGSPHRRPRNPVWRRSPRSPPDALSPRGNHCWHGRSRRRRHPRSDPSLSGTDG